MDKLILTQRITKGESGYYIGAIEEIPAILTQGKTIQETKENIIDALHLYLETNRSRFEGQNEDDVIREELQIS